MFVVTMLGVVVIGGGLAYAALPDFHRAVDRTVDGGVTLVRRQLNPASPRSGRPPPGPRPSSPAIPPSSPTTW